MRQYVINLFMNGTLCGEGYGIGNSGMEAFEKGVDEESVLLPSGKEVDVSVISETGLTVRFIAIQLS